MTNKLIRQALLFIYICAFPSYCTLNIDQVFGEPPPEQPFHGLKLSIHHQWTPSSRHPLMLHDASSSVFIEMTVRCFMFMGGSAVTERQSSLFESSTTYIILMTVKNRKRTIWSHLWEKIKMSTKLYF